jgi:hypothetical protein
MLSVFNIVLLVSNLLVHLLPTVTRWIVRELYPVNLKFMQSNRLQVIIYWYLILRELSDIDGSNIIK